MDEQLAFSSVQCLVRSVEGAAEAVPFLLVPASGRHLRCLLKPLHVDNGTHNFGVWTAIPNAMLLQWGLLRHSDGCTEVAGGMVELL